MGSSLGIAVGPDGIREHAERLLTGPVALRDLAVRFPEGRASAVELLVGGSSFYPPMLADIRSASSSVHINQFGFRPGQVGEEFANALVEKLREGIAVRLVVDRQGSDPEGGARGFYERLTQAGAEVCVVRATKPRAQRGVLGTGGGTHWNLGALGHIDHRKVVLVDGRIGWVGGAGIEDHFADGRFHDLFVRVDGQVAAQLQLVSLGALRCLGATADTASLPVLFPPLDGGASPIPATVLHNAPGRYRPITEAITRLLDQATETLDVVNPYVTDR